MKSFTLQTIRLYQKFRKFIPLPRTCRFVPTCSEYAYEAVSRYGIIKGLYLGLKRILRCHPGTKPGFDPVA
jgi:hypothetical protein